jgi:hypothetical protein
MEETIFDYRITRDELKFLAIIYQTKEDYILNTNIKKQKQDLFILFTLRGDWNKASAIKKVIITEQGK